MRRPSLAATVLATSLIAAPNNTMAGEGHCHPFPDSARLSVDETNGKVEVIAGQTELTRLGYDLNGFKAIMDFQEKTDALIATMADNGGHIDVGTFSSERIGAELDGFEITPCREDVKERLKVLGLID